MASPTIVPSSAMSPAVPERSPGRFHDASRLSDVLGDLTDVTQIAVSPNDQEVTPLAARNVVTWWPPLQVQSFLDANREVEPSAVDGAAATAAGTADSMKVTYAAPPDGSSSTATVPKFAHQDCRSPVSPVTERQPLSAAARSIATATPRFGE